MLFSHEMSRKREPFGRKREDQHTKAETEGLPMVRPAEQEPSATQPPARTRRRERSRPTREVMWLFPNQGEWTEADYFSLPETNRVVELSRGKLVIPEMPTCSHQFTLGELFALMREFVRTYRLGTVCPGPLPIRLWPGKIREPDIVFLARQHEDRRGVQFWGVPDLAVEVLSPRTDTSSGTERVDRKKKFEEYAEAGISEYWLADTQARTIEVYVLREGAYRLFGKWETGDIARSEVLNGFEVPVAAIFFEEE
jgi:Uma2 family endonuclease